MRFLQQVIPVRMSRFLEAFRYVSKQFSSVLGQEEHRSTSAPTEMYEQEQQHFESRIECGICLQPRLKMVTGKCQHRFCVGCMYDSKETRREGMKKCPSCQQDSAFPTVRPVIPEDLIEIQRALGVRKCERCGDEMWIRELLDHQRTCVESPLPTADSGNRRCKKTPNSCKRDGRVQKRSHSSKKGYEVKKLLDDLGSGPGVTTRSSRSPRMLALTGGMSERSRRAARKEKQKT
eukprot:XP_785183.2 PREDICTED: TNF receptor-associated factor 6 [Strongylocentrotus purpuratus]